MCGLTGIFSRNAITARPIENALGCTHYRGEDDRRLFTFSEKQPHFFATPFSSEVTKSKFPFAAGFTSNNWLGFNRLSIVDRSEAGMQPFWHEASQTAFMMVGEMYNYAEIFRQFFTSHEQQQFFSETDTEVAFRLYLKLGPDFIQHIRGMVSIVIADYARQKVRVYRDKIGMKPLFFAQTATDFIVSSEISGIFGTGLLEKQLNKKGLAYQLYFESSPWESSIYQNIEPLSPGHFLEFDLQTWQLKKSAYWKLTYQENNAPVATAELEQDILATARLHLAGDVPKGLSLSGGLDSGLMAYAFGKTAPVVKAFSINPQNTAADESEYAALNAQNAGLAFQNITVPNSMAWEELKPYFLSEDEPNNMPEPNTFLCRKITAQGVKVLYNALGLDEIFGGYKYYGEVKKFQNTKRLVQFLPFIPHEKTANLKRFGLLYLPAMKRENLSWNQLEALFSEESNTWQHPFEYQRDILKRLNPDFENYPVLKQLSYWDLLVYIGAHHTFRSDQSAMKATIEMRFPFLDANFVQKYFNSGRLFENLQQENKPVIRQLARKVLPKTVLEMPKKGFAMPTGTWLGPHQNQLQQQLQALSNKGIIPAKCIQKHKNNTLLQWQLCALNMLFNP